MSVHRSLNRPFREQEGKKSIANSKIPFSDQANFVEFLIVPKVLLTSYFFTSVTD